VTGQGEGVEPLKAFACGHEGAVIWANRKVVLRGAGDMSMMRAQGIRIRVSLRQLLCHLTGRSL
jgi:hypothetical protein